jgi:hypothetical protein
MLQIFILELLPNYVSLNILFINPDLFIMICIIKSDYVYFLHIMCFFVLIT